MGLTRVRLGEVLDHSDERNSDGRYTLSDVRGMSIQKTFIQTKANMDGVSLAPYKLVGPNSFAYVTVTSRNGERITLAHNDSSDTFIVSSSYEVFSVTDGAPLIPEYLFMFFNRSEFDRYSRFNSWGSARETFNWEDFCDTEIDLPPIDVQRKYVAIYEFMLANQRAYESGLDDLKLTCDALVERLMRELPHQAIGPFIEQSDERNVAGLGKEAVRGLSINKQLIETKANLDGVNLGNYKVIPPQALVYVPVTSRNGNKISIAMNEDDGSYITSAINTVFHIRAEAKDNLLPGYLMLFFGRSEFDRYARFSSWGSARETFDWAEMCDVRIPIPDVATQRYTVALYDAWRTRAAINERLKAQLKDICPILIRGSIEEATR